MRMSSARELARTVLDRLLIGDLQHFRPFPLWRLQTSRRWRNEAAIRRLCNAVVLSGDEALCRVLGRYKMYVDLHDQGLSPHLMLDGLWEVAVTEAMVGCVRPGMAVADIGANLGYFTVLLADLVGAGGSVIAAEPNPRMMSLLLRSVRLNGFAGRVRQCAQPLSARTGESVSLHVPDGLPQNGHLRASAAGGPEAANLVTVTLDDLIGDAPIDFIKIDAEGAEQAIWQGMAAILARRTALTVFIEFTPDRYADPAAFLAQMLETGFSLAIIDDNQGVLPITAERVLDGPANIDRMLVLSR